MKTFQTRQLEMTIQLANNEPFGEGIGDTITLTGLRMTAELVASIGETMGSMSAQIFGLTQDKMNKLTTVGAVGMAVKFKNAVLLRASDGEGGMVDLFRGTIQDAYGDYNAAPQVPLIIEAAPGYNISLKPLKPTSYNGAVDVAGIFSTLAQSAGLTFQNLGISGTLASPNITGSALEQIRKTAEAANVWYTIANDKLVVWPKGTLTSEPVTISPQTGMIGYPTFSSKGISIRTIFNPHLNIAGRARIESSLPMVNGKTFKIGTVAHSLSSEMPDGNWMTTATLYPEDVL